MMNTTADLLQARCQPRNRALDAAEAARLLPLAPGWALQDGQLVRTFTFSDYYRTMAFVNALAYLSHTEDHHPDMRITYKQCVVHYDTHSAHGLSENDFICAAKANALYDQAGA